MRPSHLISILLLAVGCSRAPVDWSEIVYQGAPPEPSDLPTPLDPQPDVSACPGSMRISKAGRITYAAWWTANPDSSVTLMTAREVGGRWQAPVAADSTDHGVRGCGRHAPAIVADSASGYVHLAYFAEPESGAGVFFEHSMDSAKTFHTPVAIVYGKNPSRVSIDAKGDRVVVAFEDPNSNQPIVNLALSSTMGHIFESRTRASGENGRARQPVVRLRGDSIAVWWSEYSADPAISATRTMYRAGKWK